MDHMFTRIYALLVCFATMVCLTIAIGMSLYQLVKITYPEITMNDYQYQRFQTNEAFNHQGSVLATHTSMIVNTPGVPSADQLQSLTEEEITDLRLAAYERALSNERRAAISSLVRLLIVLLVSGTVFYLHWRIAQRYEHHSSA